MDQSGGQEQLDFRVAAAIGQPLLIQEYHSYFRANNIVTSQVLVTEIDFTDPDRSSAIQTILSTMLRQGIIPIVNENDAITTRTTNLS